jgi:hypothetical protein
MGSRIMIFKFHYGCTSGVNPMHALNSGANKNSVLLRSRQFQPGLNCVSFCFSGFVNTWCIPF